MPKIDVPMPDLDRLGSIVAYLERMDDRGFAWEVRAAIDEIRAARDREASTAAGRPAVPMPRDGDRVRHKVLGFTGTVAGDPWESKAEGLMVVDVTWDDSDSHEPEMVRIGSLEPIGPEMVDHPAHYNSAGAACLGCGRPIECIDVIEAMPANIANAVKYLWRVDHKGNAIQDLEKAAWYVTRELERRRRAGDTIKEGGVSS